jgi:hydroxymethylpyrimidine/phosphomethylpyrimidine kinase
MPPLREAPQPPVALSIAGSDSAGGAGLQADLRTFAMHGVFGVTAVTVLTAQDTAEVRAIEPVPPEFVAAQLDAVLADLPLAAVKAGMLGTVRHVALVARRAADLPNLVVDPVLVARTGRPLFDAALTRAYRDELLPAATVITPNVREAGLLLGRELSTVDDMRGAAEELASSCGARCVVVTGGGLGGAAVALGGADAIDAVWCDGRAWLLTAPRIDTPNTRGTGCTFAAAVTARLAHGQPLPAALDAAKRYVTDAMRGAAGWRLGKGPGPLHWVPAAEP